MQQSPQIATDIEVLASSLSLLPSLVVQESSVDSSPSSSCYVLELWEVH